MCFAGKSVIITGGGKIARAYALGFAKEGAKVALPDIASADPVVRAIRDLGGTVLFLSSSESDFMTGQLLNVDGGFHFVG